MFRVGARWAEGWQRISSVSWSVFEVCDGIAIKTMGWCGQVFLRLLQ